MPTSFIKKHLTALLIGLGTVCILIPTLINTAPIVIDTTDHGADILFSAQPGRVMFPGNCVTVSWQAGNIQTIFLNSEPVVGAGEEQVCVNPQTQPTLTITFQDGTTQDYTLNVSILVLHPLFIVGLLFVAVALYRLVIRWRSSRAASPSSQESTPPHLPHYVRVLLVLITSLVLPVIILEIGLGMYFRNNGTRDEKIMYVLSLDEIRELDNVLVPMSYVNYAASPYYPEHNRLGYRGPDIELPKPEGVFRIVAVGGSTTYSTGTSAAESYPAQLEKILHEDYGYTHVQVINAGFIGYSTWETVTNLAFRVLEVEPDMIIHYAAVNDLVPREQIATDCYRGDNILRGINAAKGFWIERSTPLSQSVLVRFIGVNMGWIPNPLALNSAFELPNGNCENDNFLPVEERVQINRPVYFDRNLRSIIGIAQVHHVDVMLSTWAYYTQADRPDYWRTAIAEHNAITEQVSDELNIPLYDLAANFPVQADYWEEDGIHLVAAGTYEQARQYARFLVENNLIPTS